MFGVGQNRLLADVETRSRPPHIVLGRFSSPIEPFVAPSEPSVVRIHPKAMVRGRTRQYAVKALLHACCAVMIATVPTVASAESLRCNGQSVSEGDTRLALRYSCGEPLLADTYCAPVYYAPTFQPVPEPFASIVVPCQLVEEWLYDRGPGNLLAVVRIRSGVVQSIHYGRSPSRR